MRAVAEEKNVRKKLSYHVGYDTVKLHGKFRSYKPNPALGDNLTHFSLGDVPPDGESGASLVTFPRDTIMDGIEYPTYWSRLPLSIQANNRDQHKGLYSIHSLGTSLIFPLSQKDQDIQQENDMRSCTAGVYIAFETDSPNITLHFRYRNRPEVAKDGRHALGGIQDKAFSGFDIYQMVKGVPEFRQNLRAPSGVMEGNLKFKTNLIPSIEEKGQFILVLPTYNGFEPDSKSECNPSGLTLEFDSQATTRTIELFDESLQEPIVIYGTSITQGNGDNGLRPGATYPSQVMWATKREVINLGFAGSAQLEYKMADFLSQISSSAFIIDPGWNLTSKSFEALECTSNGKPANITNGEIVNRVKYMVETYRANNPTTPIIICPKYLKYGDGECNGGKSSTPPKTIVMPNTFSNPHKYLYSREGFILYKAYLELQESGIINIYFADQKVPENASVDCDRWLGHNLQPANLHPPLEGMTSIANFILETLKIAVPEIYPIGKFSIPFV